jgi:hypothetical protein
MWTDIEGKFPFTFTKYVFNKYFDVFSKDNPGWMSHRAKDNPCPPDDNGTIEISTRFIIESFYKWQQYRELPDVVTARPFTNVEGNTYEDSVMDITRAVFYCRLWFSLWLVVFILLFFIMVIGLLSNRPAPAYRLIPYAVSPEKTYFIEKYAEVPVILSRYAAKFTLEGWKLRLNFFKKPITLPSYRVHPKHVNYVFNGRHWTDYYYEWKKDEPISRFFQRAEFEKDMEYEDEPPRHYYSDPGYSSIRYEWVSFKHLPVDYYYWKEQKRIYLWKKYYKYGHDWKSAYAAVIFLWFFPIFQVFCLFLLPYSLLYPSMLYPLFHFVDFFWDLNWYICCKLVYNCHPNDICIWQGQIRVNRRDYFHPMPKYRWIDGLI